MKTKFLYLLFVFSFTNFTASAQQFTCGIFTFNAIITPPTCNGYCNGSIQIINITGGTSPYTFSWSNGDTIPNPISLCSGNYTVVITDNIGNTCSMALNIPMPVPITFSLVVTNVSCFGFSDGSICMDSLSGGTPAYIYSWNTTPIQATPCAINLSSGTIYTVCITDANGCTICDSATVIELSPLQVTENVTNASCSICCDGDIVLFPSGGTPPFNYVFTPSAPPPGNYCPNNYSYCVIDANGCSTCDTVVVSFPTSIKNNDDATTFSIFPNPANSTINIEQTSITTNNTFVLFDITGKRIMSQLLETKSTQLDISSYPKGIYFYQLLNNKEIITGKLIIGN